MTLIKNEIPILEYDDNQMAVIMPNHANLKLELPEKCVFAFLEDEIDKFAEKNRACKVSEFISCTKIYPIYVVKYEGEEICLVQAPMGSAPSGQILDWLISYGVKKIISAGTCGVLIDLDENKFIVPVKALRDEGTSYHYINPSRYIEINKVALKAIEKTLIEHGLEYVEVLTWTTDGFYRETPEKVAYRKEEGCAVVEMECSALAAVAQFRNVIWGQILFTADSLADIEKYDARNFGEDSYEYALKLCFDVLKKL